MVLKDELHPCFLNSRNEDHLGVPENWVGERWSRGVSQPNPRGTQASPCFCSLTNPSIIESNNRATQIPGYMLQVEGDNSGLGRKNPDQDFVATCGVLQSYRHRVLN